MKGQEGYKSLAFAAWKTQKSRSAILLLQLILRPGVDVFWNDSRGLFGSNDCCGNSGDKT
jgi:hypothetical protein